MLPLSDLLTGDVSWIYDHPQEEAFKKVKAMLTETPELAFNDPENILSLALTPAIMGLELLYSSSSEIR